MHTHARDCTWHSKREYFINCHRRSCALSPRHSCFKMPPAVIIILLFLPSLFFINNLIFKKNAQIHSNKILKLTCLWDERVSRHLPYLPTCILIWCILGCTPKPHTLPSALYFFKKIYLQRKISRWNSNFPWSCAALHHTCRRMPAVFAASTNTGTGWTCARIATLCAGFGARVLTRRTALSTRRHLHFRPSPHLQSPQPRRNLS